MSECTPTQLRDLLAQAKLTQRGAALALDINERTMRRYVSGEMRIPRAIYLGILAMAQLEQTAARQT